MSKSKWKEFEEAMATDPRLRETQTVEVGFVDGTTEVLELPTIAAAQAYEEHTMKLVKSIMEDWDSET